jgi:hypothetical protein
MKIQSYFQNSKSKTHSRTGGYPVAKLVFTSEGAETPTLAEGR